MHGTGQYCVRVLNRRKRTDTATKISTSLMWGKLVQAIRTRDFYSGGDQFEYLPGH